MIPLTERKLTSLFCFLVSKCTFEGLSRSGHHTLLLTYFASLLFLLAERPCCHTCCHWFTTVDRMVLSTLWSFIYTIKGFSSAMVISDSA